MEKMTVSCEGCQAGCCRYVATQLDEPADRDDFDNIRWYLMHERVHVFIDHEGDWYLEFETDCLNLSDDHLCMIYDTRPRICARHGVSDGTCEFHAEDLPYEYRFSTADEFEQYLAERGIRWRGGSVISNQ